jgi:hypothetical protein
LALLLVAAGASKLRAPAATSSALGALRVPPVLAPMVARIIGAAEVGVGIWALATGSRASAGTIAVAHLSFAVVTAALLRRPGVPCGCFGAPDAPATRAGLVVNLASAAVAGAAIAWPPGALLGAPPVTVPRATVVVLAVVGAWLVHELHVSRMAPVVGPSEGQAA